MIGDSARDVQADWLRSLGSRFVSVSLFVPSSFGIKRETEDHIDDLTTLHETVAMAVGRRNGRAAVYPYLGRWVLYTPGKEPTKKIRYYDTQEAAEMVAIHSG